MTAAVPIAEYDSIRRAQEHELVVLAMNVDCLLMPQAGGPIRLVADARHAARIAREIAEYEAEQEEEAARPAPLPLPRFRAGPWLALFWSALLMAVFVLQGRVTGLTGSLLASSAAILEHGEWWRSFTALFLHADFEHLMLNVISGVAFAMMAAAALGRLLAWSLLMLAGVCGNLLTAVAHFPEQHLSLGASTAVFGALGLLTGYGFFLAFRHPASSPWRSVLVPIGGGAALLGLQGAGGANTDVLAHLFGFLSGSVFGAAAGWWRLREAERAARRQSRE